MVFVTTADGSKALEAVSYDTLKSDSRKAARDVKKTIKDMNVVGDAPAEEKPAAAEAALEDWTNTDGITIKASVTTIEETRVRFALESGKSVWYPIDKLSTDSKKKLQESE